jgi:polyisoprenoid-binding protein YceI
MKNALKSIPVIIIAFAILLTACATPAVQGTVQPVENTSAGSAATNTAAPAPTNTASDPANTPAASQNTNGPDQTGGAATYKIVPSESKVSYEVNETLFNQNNKLNTAIGVSQVVNGEIKLDPSNPQTAGLSNFTVDVSQFKSDSGMRDNRIRSSYLESSRYPIVTFTPKSIEGLPTSYTPGQAITFKVNGDLTIHNVTKPATFDVTAKLDGNTLTGTATTSFLMSDYGFGPIQLAILQTEDKVKVTFNFVARP